MENGQEPERARGDLGRRVAQRRAELGLSQEEVAERAGMAPGYVAYLEAHPPLLTKRALYRLADALRTSTDHLLGADTDVPPGAASTAVPRPRLSALSRRACLDLIEPGGVGRVAFVSRTRSGPAVLPVNYAVTDGDIVFRTAADADVVHELPGYVGFEVDRFDETMSEGWSVLVTGLARIVHDPDEDAALRALAPVRPWAGGERETYVRVTPDRLTGRRITAGRPVRT
ncbi:pyridoxamine 5'-phosphate oxidase family protein [Nocardiopsis sp. NRRL B-16309]|uniref:helix-turn-helix domain-containing protein n=1 Tax=Nocardiopsis sp. NRRL B-16309 TaxID=1519494 RepID=UPI0006AE6E45|nr:pyridoxamine 5'-phosphate oxidase family protein [Nocardiopsis sp. NRRL B-16309]KOX17342.1 DNA-binding protein [Nocardiopsis sp. NRRL B-16309]